MKNRKAAVVTAAGVLVLISGAGLATAATGSTGSPSAPASTVEDDDVNQGPDANPNEPGHQDATDDDSGETEADSGSESEDPADGDVNQGPDANPSEPGHQDADNEGEAD